MAGSGSEWWGLAPSGRRAGVLLLALVCCWLVPGGAAGAPSTGAPVPPAILTPGAEIRIDDPQTGGLGYWTIYLPSDFNPDRRWPVVFCFHGLGQKPGAWPFRQLTDGRGFVIVGMEYLQRGLDGIRRDQEAANLRRVVALVRQWLPVDERALLVGGFSKGGWHTSNMAERTAPLWAGAVILGAGRSSTPDPGGLRGKPVFIGIGERDIEHAAAVAAADFYRRLEASVTFVTFSGLGHTVDTGHPVLRQWLRDQVADRQVADYRSDLQQRKPR